MKEVYINDILCDLDEKENPIALSYEVNDLAELKDRQAYSSNNFKLPPTQNNRRACGFPDTGSIIGLQPYRNNTCKIVQDGIEILTNGIAIITGTNDDINVQALSGLKGFFESIEGKYITDIDLSAYDHFFNVFTIQESQSNTWEDGYIWPIIDYGAISATEKIVDVKQLRPAVFRKILIDAIVADTGYTMSGVILSDLRHLTALIPFAGDKFEHAKRYQDTQTNNTATARNQILQTFPSSVNQQVVQFLDDAGTDPQNLWSGTEYAAPGTISVDVKLKYDIEIRDQYKGGTTPSVNIQIQKFSAGVWTTLAENVHTAVGEFQNYMYEDQILETTTNLVSGEKIRINKTASPATDRVTGTLYPGASVQILNVLTDVIYGQEVQLEATLPKISQKDFFKDWLQNFGLIVIPDPYKKHITVINMQEVYENKYRAHDWTSKFTDRVPDIKYAFGSYGVQNFGRYKDDDNVPDGTGDGVLLFDNQTLKASIELFTSQFAASVFVNKMNGVNVTEIRKIEDPDKSLDFTIKTESRILLDSKQNISIQFFVGDALFTQGFISLPYFQKAGSPGLGYDELFAEYYPEILRMLYRPFVKTASILITPTDLQNIDFSIPIFDTKDQAYYYNNGILDYIAGEEAKISLIKMF